MSELDLDKLAEMYPADTAGIAPYVPALIAEHRDLRARLAAVEAERDAIQALLDDVTADASKLADRLAEVRALCERNFNMEDYYEIDANDVAAILEGRAVPETEQ